MEFSLAQVAEITGGVLCGDNVNLNVKLDGATQDSRRITPACLFVPLRAERDGHDFISAALAAGAAGFLTEQESTLGPSVLVPDTASALQALGAASRTSITAPVVGVTGSVGKTSVKDLTSAVLNQKGPVHASPRSFNNEIGVPLTLLNTPEEATAVVAEMGARHPGDISNLCAMVRPDVGVITTIGMAHTGVFGSLEAVAQAKGEIIVGLPATGCAVLNADVPAVMAQADRTRAHVLTFGQAGEVRAREVRVGADLRPSFLLESPWGRIEVRLETRGAHMVTNALAAAAVGLVLDLSLEEVAAGLAKATLSPSRMQLGTAPSGLLVIDDAYNANPLSVGAALEALATVEATGRRVAVLGLMAELGDDAPFAHQQMAQKAAALGVELLTVGTDLYGPPPETDIDAALKNLGPGDVVLVKGSLVAGLQALASRLLAG
jgi:UDP-N-acetylmuramoyl-tripeptide--D-alanyl-D-alanine ligase